MTVVSVLEAVSLRQFVVMTAMYLNVIMLMFMRAAPYMGMQQPNRHQHEADAVKNTGGS